MSVQTISIQDFHALLAWCYAVCVNDNLYFVGYDNDGNPFISDNNGDDYVDLSTVDGDIELYPTYVHFYIQEQPFIVQFLSVNTI